MTVFRCSSALLAGFGLAGSFFLGAAPLAQAQRTTTSELGLGLGATTYKGEVSPQWQLQNQRPALTAFYRRDVSVPITLRAGFTAGQLRATDTNVTGAGGTTPPLQAYRQLSLSGSVYELAGVMEYNFLDYHRRRQLRRPHLTPYLFIGVAGYYANTTLRSANADLQADFNRSGGRLGLAVPAGAGLKIALSEHFNLGLEVGVRKTFTDQFDHAGDQAPLLVNPRDQDWYYYSGVSLSYTFFKIQCPSPYKGNKRLLQ